MSSLEFVLDPGIDANAFDFFSSGKHLLDLLDSLTEATIDWQLADLSKSSARAVIAAPAHQRMVGSAAIESTIAGLRVIRGGAVPTDWAPDAVEAGQAFTRTVRPSGDRIRAQLRLVWDSPTLIDDAVVLDDRLCDAMSDLTPFERRFRGSVRGTLVGFSVARGNRASLRTADGHTARVKFSDDLRTAFKEALMTDVEIFGALRKDSTGQVFHVAAEAVQPIASRTDRGLRWVDLFGSDPEITGGLTIGDYLKESRGEA